MKRKSSLKRPYSLRKINYKRENTNEWKEGVVKHFYSEEKPLLCKIVDKDQEVEVDFSNPQSKWEYTKFYCNVCNAGYDTDNGLGKHKILSRKEDHEFIALKTILCDECGGEFFHDNDLYDHKIKVHKSITFESDSVCENKINMIEAEREKLCVSAQMMRFKEIVDERENNLLWRKQSQDTVYYAEIVENEDNKEIVKLAKEKELRNLDEFKVFKKFQRIIRLF